MMTNYRLRTRRKRNGGRTAWIVLFVVIFILGFIRPVWFEQLILVPLKPLHQLGTVVKTPFEGLRFIVEDKMVLKNKNEELFEELRAQRTQKIILRDQLIRYQIQAGLQSTTTPSESNGVQGFVIKRPPTTAYDQLLVDIGDHEIQEGDWVTYKGMYLGEVTKVFGGIAKVTLLSSPSETTRARINHSIDVTIKGQGGLGMLIELPQDVPVEVGDLVSLSTSDSYPVGLVSYIEINETTSFQEIYVGTPFTLQDITYVTVGTAGIPDVE